jgi:hypothetical protein
MGILFGGAILFIIVLIISINGNKKIKQLEQEDPTITKYLGDKY